MNRVVIISAIILVFAITILLIILLRGQNTWLLKLFSVAALLCLFKQLRKTKKAG